MRYYNHKLLNVFEGSAQRVRTIIVRVNNSLCKTLSTYIRYYPVVRVLFSYVLTTGCYADNAL